MPESPKEIEEKLAISELKFRRLFESAQDGILLIDPITEKIIDANPYLLQIIGYSLEETIGKKLWEVGAFEDIEAAKTVFKELQAKRIVRYEDLPLKTKDGREIDVEFVSNLYVLGSAGMIQCNIRDITDRRLVEKRAKAYLERLEKLNSFMMGREVKMAELKEEINKLKQELLSDIGRHEASPEKRS